MSTIGFFVSIATMFVFIIWSQISSRRGDNGLKKHFYLLIGTFTCMTLAGAFYKSVILALIGLIILGIAGTIYLFRLKDVFKLIDEEKKLTKYIDSNPNLFEEETDEIRRLNCEIIQAELKILEINTKMLEKARNDT